MPDKKNPFSKLFAVFENDASIGVVEGINSTALDRLKKQLLDATDPSGCVIVLRSPRAGYGKTALMKRVSHELANTHLFLPIRLLNGHRLDSGQLLEDVLSGLSEQLPSHIGLTAIDEVSRKILAKGLEPMIASGEIACQNRDESLAALENNALETFDFHNPQAATALWIRDNFESVGARLASELSLQSGATLRDVAYWLELFYRYASTSPNSVARNGQLFETVFGGHERKGPIYTDKLMGLLKLLNLVTRPVLILDDTEGLSNLPAESLEAISGLVSISQSCAGSSVLLCLNSDIWTSAIEPRLPCGLKDRILHRIIDLKPLTDEQARSLICHYAGETSGQWIDDLDLGEEPLYARGILKKASDAWDDLLENDEFKDILSASPEPISEPDEEGLNTSEITEQAEVEELVKEPSPFTAVEDIPAEKDVIREGADSSSLPEKVSAAGRSTLPVAVNPFSAVENIETAADEAGKNEAKAQIEEVSQVVKDDTAPANRSIFGQEAASSVDADQETSPESGFVAVNEDEEEEEPQALSNIPNPFQAVVEESQPLDETSSETPPSAVYDGEDFAVSSEHTIEAKQISGQEAAEMEEPLPEALPLSPAGDADSFPSQSPFSVHTGFSPFQEIVEENKTQLPEPKQAEPIVYQPPAQVASPFTAASGQPPVAAEGGFVAPSPFEVAGPGYPNQLTQPVQPVQIAQRYEQPMAASARQPISYPQSMPQQPQAQNPFEKKVDSKPAVPQTQLPQAATPEEVPFKNPFGATGDELNQAVSADIPAADIPDSSEEKRVEDLLEQFKNRYGRD